VSSKKKKWVELTDEEITEMVSVLQWVKNTAQPSRNFILMIQNKLKEKNT
jgi:hypothetical protein